MRVLGLLVAAVFVAVLAWNLLADRTPYTPAARPGGGFPAPGSCHVRGRGLYVLPDPRCTPGAIDARVTQANAEDTICARGWTATVRPPEAVTERDTRQALAAYGYYAGHRVYQLDHLVPVELGGSNAGENLWLEVDYPGGSPRSGYLNPKDRVEERLHALVCQGRISLARAQTAIRTDWITALGGAR
jgi:hypothetical protein